MRGRLLLTLIAILIVLMGKLHILLKPQPSQQELRQVSGFLGTSRQWQGKLAPDFHIDTTQGDHFQLSDNIGKKVIVLDFFATWCGPCREEMPEMERYLQAHKNEPFLLLAIDAEEKKEQVNGFFQELKLAFPVGIDEGPIRKAYGVTAFPTTILIGVDGKVQFYEAGALANADVAFDSFLRMNREMLKSGHAISKDSYLAQLGQAARETAATGHDDVFDGRAKRIAARMDCPCGCDKRVGACQCHTARGVRKALASGGFGKAPDAEIIKTLNKTFCIGQARRDASCEG